MRVAVDISLYPLTEDYIPPIRDVIERLNGHADIEVVTNPMATQLRGEYSAVMDLLKSEIGTTFEQLPHAIFTIKILNNPHTD